MKEYFERQLQTAPLYTKEDVEDDLLLASTQSLSYQERVDRAFSRIGQRIVYFVVRNLNTESSVLNVGTMLKCYENELEKYSKCLEYVEMYNEDFPMFNITDIDLLRKIRSERNQVMDNKEEKSNIVLEAVAYKVKQTYNTHHYVIKQYNLTGSGRWYVLCGTETFPETFNMYDDFRNGFETVEDAMNQLEIYLKTTSK